MCVQNCKTIGLVCEKNTHARFEKYRFEKTVFKVFLADTKWIMSNFEIMIIFIFKL